MLHTLGARVARRAPWVLWFWLAATVAGFGAAVGGVGGQGLFDRLTSGEPTVPGEAQQGRDVLAAADPGGAGLQLLVVDISPADPQVIRILQDQLPDVQALAGVDRLVDPSRQATGGTGAPAPGDVLLVPVTLIEGAPPEQTDAVVDSLRDLGSALEAVAPDAAASVGGVDLLVDEITEQVETDLRTGEGIALPISLVVMVVVFGGLLAAAMPIVGAIASIAGGLAALLGFSYLTDLDATVVNVVTVLGLGLCIDYGLLVVSRFREEIRRDRATPSTGGAITPTDIHDAVGRTLATAGRTVLFSGLTVAISLSGLIVFDAEILRAIGAAGVSVVLVAVLVALTLVPALLAVAGSRMLRPGIGDRVPGLRVLTRRWGDVAPPEGAFSRLARRVQRRPATVALLGTVLLLALAAPALHLQLRSSGPELLPVGSEQRTHVETLLDRVPEAADPAVSLVARTDPAALDAWARRVDVAGVRDVTAVTAATQVGTDHAMIGVQVAGADPGGEQAQDVVRRIRDLREADPAQTPVLVTGQAAGLVDFVASILSSAPIAIGIVVAATFVLLFSMTGSLLIPVKALVMNVLSLGASFGVLVWGFQDGALEGLLSFSSTGGIETVIPPLLLAFGFGLAMDYEVFLLSRITEARAAGAASEEAVAIGLQQSGRIITCAALIIVLVFSGFVVGDLIIVKQTGAALAVAVAVDATLVRCLLVPATMTLLGEWNWWAPAPLRRLHDRFGLRDA